MARGSLAGASWQWEGSCLTIKLKGNGKDALLKNAPKVADELSKRFGTDVSINIVPGENLEGPALFDAMEKLRSQMLEETPSVSVLSKPAAVAPVMSSDTIFGKPFKGAVTPMKDVDLNMGNVIIEGSVFAIDHKELTKRNAVVVKFDVTDHTS
jgi:DNA polymerase III alpha subunit (gram-positive type)